MILNKVFVTIIYIFLFIIVLSIILLSFLNKEIHKPLGILEDDSFNEIGEELKNKIDDLIEKRIKAKQDKNFDDADKIRQVLLDLGVEIKDTSNGTTWNPK